MNAVIVIYIHRTELEEYELPSVLPHAHLAEQNRPFGSGLDKNGNQYAEGQTDERENQTSHNVEPALQNEQRLLSVGLRREIRIERGVAWPPRPILFPVVGIVVQRNTNKVKLLET